MPAIPDSSLLAALRAALRAAARPEDAAGMQRYFKTGPGEYGAGDRFLGVRVPETRRLAATSDALPPRDVVRLLRSPIHEERLLALLILVRRFGRGGEAEREKLVGTYLRARRFVNNWDLVDTSAPYLLGAWLLPRDRSLLGELIVSPDLWERRIAMVSTLAFIRAGDLGWTFRLAEALLGDPHDLLHKAAGWMLREAGGRDVDALRAFLQRLAPRLPRTMLRYAIERLPAAERATWLQQPRAAKERSPGPAPAPARGPRRIPARPPAPPRG